MTIIRVQSNAPCFMGLSTDIALNTFTGATSFLGAKFYTSDDGKWYSILADGTLSPYNFGNIGRYSTSVTPVAQVSTASSVLVVGSIIDTLNTSTISYSIHNTGAESIDWIVYGGNVANLSDKVVVNASATITAGSRSSYSSATTVWQYYGIYIVDTVGAAHGEATIVGVSKG